MKLKKHISFTTLVLALSLGFTSCEKADFSSAKQTDTASDFEINTGFEDGMDLYDADKNSEEGLLRDDIVISDILGSTGSNSTSSRPGGGNSGGGDGGDSGDDTIGDSEDLSESGTSKNKPKTNSSN